MRTRYRHTQTGTVILVSVVGSAVVMAAIALATVWSGPLAAGFGAMAVVLGLVGWQFLSLTVEVADGTVELFFGPGHIHRTIALDDVTAVRARRSSWLLGFGIRWVPGGWMWNVSGLDAVELTFADGRRFRIGTDEPKALETALRAAMAL